MEKYKLCPGCGFHNNPLAIECESCGEDLSSSKILDAEAEEQLFALTSSAGSPQRNIAKMVRICEECGTKNNPQARKCACCGEDISLAELTSDDEAFCSFSLSSTDGEYTFLIPGDNETVIIGRESKMQEYLKNKLYVSRRHAELMVVDGKLQIKSFATTTNGTYVNGSAVSPNEAIELNPGDVVSLGGNDAATQKEAAYFQVVVL